MRLIRLSTLVFLAGFAFTACTSNPLAPNDCPEPETCGFPTTGN